MTHNTKMHHFPLLQRQTEKCTLIRHLLFNSYYSPWRLTYCTLIVYLERLFTVGVSVQGRAETIVEDNGSWVSIRTCRDNVSMRQKEKRERKTWEMGTHGTTTNLILSRSQRMEKNCRGRQWWHMEQGSTVAVAVCLAGSSNAGLLKVFIVNNT